MSQKKTLKIMTGLIMAIVAIIIYRINYKSNIEVLYFYNWSEYIPDEVIDQFTQETGIQVIKTTYDSNEAMFAKMVILKGKGYDLIVPSTYYVQKLYKSDMLLPIDKSKIKNYNYIDPMFLNKKYDPNNKYSIPYFWGATLIALNKNKVDKTQVTKWADLWNDKYKNKLMLMNDIREVFHIALAKNGFSGNSTNPKEIEIAYESLKQLMKNVAVFNSDTPFAPYIEGNADIGMIWNGSAYTAHKQNPAIDFVYPEEGAILWIDNLTIPKKAKNVDSAYKMINFLLRPEIAAKIAINTGYATPNKKALELLPDEIKYNDVIYPSKEIFEKGEIQEDIGEAILIYEKYWQKLRT